MHPITNFLLYAPTFNTYRTLCLNLFIVKILNQISTVSILLTFNYDLESVRDFLKFTSLQSYSARLSPILD